MVRILALAALALSSSLLAGCSGAGDLPPPAEVEASVQAKPAPSAPDVCEDHDEGCPCYEPGASIDCGRVNRVAGNYVWCATGHQTCSDDGKWGKCTGDQIAGQDTNTQ